MIVGKTWNHRLAVGGGYRRRRVVFPLHLASAKQGDGAVKKECGENSFQKVAIEIAHQIGSHCRSQRSSQLQCHAEANVGGVALQVNRGTRG